MPASFDKPESANSTRWIEAAPEVEVIDQPQPTQARFAGPAPEPLDSQRRNQRFHWREVITLAVASMAAGVLFHVAAKLLNANEADPVAQFIEQMAGPFLAPFVGFTQAPWAAGKPLETPVFIAVAACVILGLLMIRARGVFSDRGKVHGAAKVQPDL
jgi:type IV secretory pathway VirB2 component (pilin)